MIVAAAAVAIALPAGAIGAPVQWTAVQSRESGKVRCAPNSNPRWKIVMDDGRNLTGARPHEGESIAC